MSIINRRGIEAECVSETNSIDFNKKLETFFRTHRDHFIYSVEYSTCPGPVYSVLITYSSTY